MINALIGSMRQSRPTYETKQDVVNEYSVIDKIRMKWNVTARKMPPFYQVDWALMRGTKVHAFVEIKCRKNKRSQYATLMLSLHKWLNGMRLSQETGIPFLLIVRWEDGIYYLKPRFDLKPEVAVGGRTDRDDPDDMEPVVLIPTNWFEKVD